MINERNKLLKRKKRQPMHENVKIFYNRSRNKVNRELKKSKILYYTKYFEDNKNDIKKTRNGITLILLVHHHLQYHNKISMERIQVTLRRLLMD